MAPSIWNVLSESIHIINSQPRHYLTLSLIFLLPFSFLILISKLIIKHLQQQQPPIIISLYLLFLILSSIFSYSAFIAITYSVYNAFFNQPVKLKEAIKSITTSFFPLLATEAIISPIFFVNFFLFVYIKSYSYLVMLFYMVLMLVFMSYLEVNLGLVKVIVVVESSWGLEPLKRSWKLVKGMRKLVLSIFYLFGFLEVILRWISGYNLVLIFVISPIQAMLMLYNIAVFTVIYTYTARRSTLKLERRNLKRQRTRLACP